MELFTIEFWVAFQMCIDLVLVIFILVFLKNSKSGIRSEASREMKLPPGTYVCIGVADTGGGIRASIKDKIFDPYFTTKEKGTGTGLGLSVVSGIVKNYGGDICFFSEPGKGSLFQVYLPICS